MRALVYSPRAAADLLGIWDYIAADRPSAADRMIGRIDEAARRLADRPGMGHRRRDVRDPNYRFWVIRPYLIAYRHDSSSLTIVRIVHGARNVRLVLTES